MSDAWREHLDAKIAAALADLENQLRSANRVAIGPPRWEPDDFGNMHFVVDSVPVNTVKLLGKDEVWRRYQQAVKEREADRNA